MRTKWLLLDANYLCWRAYHVFKSLTHKAEPTGAIFGMVRDVRTLMQVHRTRNVVFCFDYGPSLRKNIYPKYKAKRHEDDPVKEEFRTQIDKLRSRLLKDIGFVNVFYESGYEADDLLASCVMSLDPKRDRVVVVSADKDLYQLIRRKFVVCYNPHQKVTMTEMKFRRLYGIKPEDWIIVKAIAGCGTDEVPGIRGVGEKTACKYLQLEREWKTGELLEADQAKWQKVLDFVKCPDFKRNLQLVRLPLDTDTVSCPCIVPQPQPEIKIADWKRFAKKFGIRSIRDLNPGSKSIPIKPLED